MDNKDNESSDEYESSEEEWRDDEDGNFYLHYSKRKLKVKHMVGRIRETDEEQKKRREAWLARVLEQAKEAQAKFGKDGSGDPKE